MKDETLPLGRAKIESAFPESGLSIEELRVTADASYFVARFFFRNARLFGNPDFTNSYP